MVSGKPFTVANHSPFETVKIGHSPCFLIRYGQCCPAVLDIWHYRVIWQSRFFLKKKFHGNHLQKIIPGLHLFVVLTTVHTQLFCYSKDFPIKCVIIVLQRTLHWRQQHAPARQDNSQLRASVCYLPPFSLLPGISHSRPTRVLP